MAREKHGGGLARAAGALALGLGAAMAGADVVDLTTAGSSGQVNGAIFETFTFQPAGTGFIDPFVRLQANGSEQGYNTSGRPVAFDEKTDPNFTRDLRLGEVRTVSVDGSDFYEFLLDINESSGNGRHLLSLDAVQIYTSDTGGATTSDVASLGTLRYDLDTGGDSWVRLNYDLASGSGEGDMRMLVPVAAFGGAGPDTFVYLYSLFGLNEASDAGFEEWSVIIPLPPAAWLGAAGLGLVVAARVARRLGRRA